MTAVVTAAYRRQREAFVSAAPSDDVREFLSWFTETAMFDAFVQSCEKHTESADGEPRSLLWFCQQSSSGWVGRGVESLF